MTPAIGRAPYLGEYPLVCQMLQCFIRQIQLDVFLFHQLFLQSSKMEVEYLFGDIFIYWRKRNHLGETSQKFRSEILCHNLDELSGIRSMSGLYLFHNPLASDIGGENDYGI